MQIAELALMILYTAVLAVVFFWLFIDLPMKMAKARNREPFAWVLISLLATPFVAVFLLLLTGHRAETT